MLTVRFDDVTYAEFAVATELNNARSMSHSIHNHAVTTISEVKKEIGVDRFAELVAAKLAELKEKGKKKAAERKRGLTGPRAKKAAKKKAA